MAIINFLFVFRKCNFFKYAEQTEVSEDFFFSFCPLLSATHHIRPIHLFMKLLVAFFSLLFILQYWYEILFPTISFFKEWRGQVSQEKTRINFLRCPGGLPNRSRDSLLRTQIGYTKDTCCGPNIGLDFFALPVWC